MALEDFCRFRSNPHLWTPSCLLGPLHSPTSSTSGSAKLHHSGRGGPERSNRDDGPPLHLFIPPPTPSSRPPAAPSVRRPFPLAHGTTTLAFVFQGGVIAAADTRASAGGLVACPSVHKIIPVHSHLVVTSSGSGADCVLWARALEREIRLYRLRHGRRLSVRGSAKLLAFMLHPFKGTDVCVALTLCGWDQGQNGGPPDGGDRVAAGSSGDATTAQALGLVDVTSLASGHVTPGPVAEQPSSSSSSSSPSPPLGPISPATSSSSSSSSSSSPRLIPPVTSSSSPPSSSSSSSPSPPLGPISPVTSSSSPPSSSSSAYSAAASVGPKVIYVCSDGSRMQGELFSVGSGSPYAYGVLDGGLRWTLSREEAASLAREAVFRATHRDAYSGNNVDLVYITERGWSRREREDLKEEYYRRKEEMGKRMEERRRMTD